FAAGKSALAVPFELDDNNVDNHIYLHVSVNNSPPLSFVLDTGASHTILSLRTARSFGMGLQLLGKATDATGIEPPDAYLVTDKVSLSLPGVTLSDQLLVAMSLDMTQDCIGGAGDRGIDRAGPSAEKVNRRTRRVVDGILGSNFFSSFVVEIDYAARLINLYDPQSYKYTGKGKSVPLEIDPKYAFVRAQVKALGRPPVTARLIVDTGGGAALWLTKQFTEAHKLLPPAEKLTPFIDCGAGGSAKEKSWTGSLEALQLGGFKLSNPAAVFYQEPAIEGSDGLLGNPALRHFKVIFDYSRSRMILEPPRRIRGNN
ncbi:MAG: aspartyl protease family protein, partial [Chloracidobacterium sp.]|nr:aspartyl protease family protein [Chloracidobacterium sp.]